MSLNGIQHLTSAPYHPASNGLAERAVQTFKNAMKKLSGGSVQDRVNQFLFRYRVTPQSTTGHSPAELLFNRRIKCPLELPRPDLKSKICEKQRAFKARHDEKAVSREFQEGEPVYYRNFSGRGNRNLPGVITENLGGKGYVIRDTNENKVVRLHPDLRTSQRLLSSRRHQHRHLLLTMDNYPSHLRLLSRRYEAEHRLRRCRSDLHSEPRRAYHH